MPPSPPLYSNSSHLCAVCSRLIPVLQRFYLYTHLLSEKLPLSLLNHNVCDKYTLGLKRLILHIHWQCVFSYTFERHKPQCAVLVDQLAYFLWVISSLHTFLHTQTFSQSGTLTSKWCYNNQVYIFAIILPAFKVL